MFSLRFIVFFRFGSRAQGSGFRVQGLGFRVQGSGGSGVQGAQGVQGVQSLKLGLGFPF